MSTPEEVAREIAIKAGPNEWGWLLVDIAAAIRAATAKIRQERDDIESDYLRRHKDACDEWEKRLLVEAERDRLAKEVERMMAALVRAEAILNGPAGNWKAGSGVELGEICYHARRHLRKALSPSTPEGGGG